MQSANLRCVESDVSVVEAFYCEKFGFKVEEDASEDGVLLSRGSVKLHLNADANENHYEVEAEDRARAYAPAVELEVDDLKTEILALREQGAAFCSDLIRDDDGLKIYLCDPSGNMLKLYEPIVELPKRRVRGVYCVTAAARRRMR